MRKFKFLKTSFTLGSLTCPVVDGVNRHISQVVENRIHLPVCTEVFGFEALT